MIKRKSIIVQVLIGFLSLFCLNCGWLFSKRMIEVQRLKSPNGEREAILKKTESNYYYLITKAKDKSFETCNPIYSETNLDGDILTDFVSFYPTRKWINDKVFFVGFNEEYKNSKDIILIKNSSSKIIDQIEIDSFGIYFVNEIQPDEVVKIPVTWSKDESLPKSIKCSFSAEVSFADRTIIPLKLNFSDDVLKDNRDKTPCESVEVNVFDSKIVFGR